MCMEIVLCCICSSKIVFIFLCVRHQDCHVIILFFVLSISDSILWHSSIYYVFHSVIDYFQRDGRYYLKADTT